jgi:hypothetical protein
MKLLMKLWLAETVKRLNVKHLIDLGGFGGFVGFDAHKIITLAAIKKEIYNLMSPYPFEIDTSF